jgi:hypothetical protein
MDLEDSFACMEIDNEWSELHSWLIKFRGDHGLTAKEFLRAVELNPEKNYFIQLASQGGRKQCPSKKKSSLGKQFRDAIRDLKNMEELSPRESWADLEKDTDDSESVRQWKNDNREILEQLGIRDVTISSNGHVVLHHLDSCTVSDDDFAKIVDESFQPPFFLTGREIRRQRTQLLSTSVLALSAGINCGTGTSLNIHGFVLCLTCKHVVNAENSVKLLPPADVSNEKYMKVHDNTVLGYTMPLLQM